MIYRQEGLYSYLLRRGLLNAVINEPHPLANSGVINALTGQFVPIPMADAHIYCGRIRNVMLFKRKYFLTSDHALLAEGLTHSDYFINWTGFDESGLGPASKIVSNNLAIDISEAPQPVEIAEPVIFIGGDTIVEPNWAHWFFEHLLKLHVLEICGVHLDLPVIVSNRLPRRFLEWGDILIGKPIHWRPLDLDQPLRFREAFVASCPAYRDKARHPHIWAHGFGYLRQRMSSLLPEVEPTHCTFFSRQSSKYRRAENEGELYEIAREVLGARLASLGTLSVLSQVQSIRGTHTAIFFGGADGPMSLFLPQDATTIEITAPGHGAFYTCLAFLALKNMRYSRIEAKTFVGEAQGAHPLNRDYLVDKKIYRQRLNTVNRV
jgi:hypothetical protein